jgi:hypothetical protein
MLHQLGVEQSNQGTLFDGFLYFLFIRFLFFFFLQTTLGKKSP